MQSSMLVELERRAYRTVVDDGLLDILLGILVLLLGLSAGTGPDFPLLLWLVLSPFIWRGLRSRWIEPRVGHVQFGASRRARVQLGKLSMVAAVCLYVGAIMTFVSLYGSLCRQPVDRGSIFTGVLLGTVLALGGLFLQMKRWIAYSVIAVTMGFVEFSADLTAGAGHYLLGSVAVGCGLFLLGRFLHNNPMIHQESWFDV